MREVRVRWSGSRGRESGEQAHDTLAMGVALLRPYPPPAPNIPSPEPLPPNPPQGEGVGGAGWVFSSGRVWQRRGPSGSMGVGMAAGVSILVAARFINPILFYFKV